MTDKEPPPRYKPAADWEAGDYLEYWRTGKEPDNDEWLAHQHMRFVNGEIVHLQAPRLSLTLVRRVLIDHHVCQHDGDRVSRCRRDDRRVGSSAPVRA